MRRVYIKLALAACSIVVSLGIAELTARILLPPQQVVAVTQKTVSPSGKSISQVVEPDGFINAVIDWSGRYGIRLNPNISATIINHTVSKRDVLIETNSIGLRYRELGPKKRGEKRVLVLGDSITFGDYLDESGTYTFKMEQLLSKNDKSISVINAGLPGANSSDEYYHYLEIKDLVQPDIVLVGMYLNDSQNSEKFYARRFVGPVARSRLFSWLANRILLKYQNSLLREVSVNPVSAAWKEEFRRGRKLVSGNRFDSPDGFDFEIYNAASDFGLAWNPASWVQLTEIMTSFRDVVRQEGQQFGLFLFPVHLQVYGSVANYYPQEKFLKMCRKLGVPCLDLQPILKEAYQDRKEKLYFDHCHLNEGGNQIAADALVEWLTNADSFPG